MRQRERAANMVLAAGEHAGWLRKKGESSLAMFRTWTRLWAVLRGDALLFFAGPAAAPVLASHSLRGARVSVLPNAKHENYFELELHGQTLRLSAPSELALLEWLAHLERGRDRGTIPGLTVDRGGLGRNSTTFSPPAFVSPPHARTAAGTGGGGGGSSAGAGDRLADVVRRELVHAGAASSVRAAAARPAAADGDFDEITEAETASWQSKAGRMQALFSEHHTLGGASEAAARAGSDTPPPPPHPPPPPRPPPPPQQPKLLLPLVPAPQPDGEAPDVGELLSEVAQALARGTASARPRAADASSSHSASPMPDVENYGFGSGFGGAPQALSFASPPPQVQIQARPVQARAPLPLHAAPLVAPQQATARASEAAPAPTLKAALVAPAPAAPHAGRVLIRRPAQPHLVTGHLGWVSV